MLADSVVIIALTYIERGMKAEKKLRELEAVHEQQAHEAGKAQTRAEQNAIRHAQKQTQKHKKVSGGATKKINNIQQPSKRD
jgi:hypothetical protein